MAYILEECTRMYRKTFLKALASRSARLVLSRCRLRVRWRSQQSVRTRARRPLSATRAVSTRQCRHPVPVALILSNRIKANQIESLCDRIIDHFTRSSFSRNLTASLPLVLCAAARPPIGLISTGAFSATDFKSWLSTIAVPLPLSLSGQYCLLYSNRTCVQSREQRLSCIIVPYAT